MMSGWPLRQKSKPTGNESRSAWSFSRNQSADRQSAATRDTICNYNMGMLPASLKYGTPAAVNSY
jgi:hypothetical protein